MEKKSFWSSDLGKMSIACIVLLLAFPRCTDWSERYDRSAVCEPRNDSGRTGVRTYHELHGLPEKEIIPINNERCPDLSGHRLFFLQQAATIYSCPQNPMKLWL